MASAPPARAAHSDLTLLDAVAQAARQTRPNDPAGLSQADFDAARDQLEPPGLPMGKSIARRLGVPWARVVEIALEALERHAILLGRLTAVETPYPPSLEQVAVAMRQAAVRLDTGRLSIADYETARRRILAASARTRDPGADRALMPTATQIEGALRTNRLSWADGCRRAGLKPPLDHGEVTRRQAMDAAAAVRWFADATGHVPAGFRQLIDTAKTAGVAVKRMRWANIQHAIDDLQTERSAKGLEPLPVVTDREVLARAVERGPGHAPARHASAWTREEIVAGLARAVALLQPGEQLGQRQLKRIAAEHRAQRIPTYSVVQRHAALTDTTFDALRRQALRMAERSR